MRNIGFFLCFALAASLSVVGCGKGKQKGPVGNKKKDGGKKVVKVVKMGDEEVKTFDVFEPKRINLDDYIGYKTTTFLARYGKAIGWNIKFHGKDEDKMKSADLPQKLVTTWEGLYAFCKNHKFVFTIDKENKRINIQRGRFPFVIHTSSQGLHISVDYVLFGRKETTFELKMMLGQQWVKKLNLTKKPRALKVFVSFDGATPIPFHAEANPFNKEKPSGAGTALVLTPTPKMSVSIEFAKPLTQPKVMRVLRLPLKKMGKGEGIEILSHEYGAPKKPEEKVVSLEAALNENISVRKVVLYDDKHKAYEPDLKTSTQKFDQDLNALILTYAFPNVTTEASYVGVFYVKSDPIKVKFSTPSLKVRDLGSPPGKLDRPSLTGGISIDKAPKGKVPVAFYYTSAEKKETNYDQGKVVKDSIFDIQGIQSGKSPDWKWRTGLNTRICGKGKKLRYEIRKLPFGKYLLYVVVNGSHVTTRYVDTILKHSELSFDIALDKAVSVSLGFETKGERPFQGLKVVFTQLDIGGKRYPVKFPPKFEGRTDAQGKCYLRYVAPGTYEVQAFREKRFGADKKFVDWVKIGKTYTVDIQRGQNYFKTFVVK